MKRVVSAIAAAAFAFSVMSPALAAFNPHTIEDSSSRDNIYRLIEKKMADGETSGVIGAFAWASVNGQIYSLNTNELRKGGSREAAVEIFRQHIQEQIGLDIELKIEDLQEAQNLFDKVRSAQPDLHIDVVKAIVEAQFPNVVFYETVTEKVVEILVEGPERVIEVEVERIVEVPGETVYVDREVIVEVERVVEVEV